MLGLTRKTRMDRVKDALSEALAYTDEIVRDERLRAHLRSAVDHGTEAGNRLVASIAEGSATSRLTSDAKLRKSLRALVDDLESAGERVRRERSHGVRNALLITAGTGATLATVPSIRRWVASRSGGPSADAIAA